MWIKCLLHGTFGREVVLFGIFFMKKRMKCQLFKLVKISLRIFYLSFIHVIEGIFVILYSDYGTLNPNCRCETSSIMASDKAVYAVPSMAESQNDKSVQGGHWVGR